MNEVWTVDEVTHETFGFAIPIYVVSTKEEALRRVKILNKNHSFGVELNECGTDAADTDANKDIIDANLPYRFYNVGSYDVDGEFYEEHNDE